MLLSEGGTPSTLGHRLKALSIIQLVTQISFNMDLMLRFWPADW